MENKTQEALKMAIEFIDNVHEGEWLYVGFDREDVINACKEALATNEECSVVQPAQEPVAYVSQHILNHFYAGSTSYIDNENDGIRTIPLYTHPHPWQGLTDDEIHNIADYSFPFPSEMFDEIFAFARAIEQELKEKNT